MRQDAYNDHTTFLESYPHEFQNHVVLRHACTEFYLLFSFYLTFFFLTKKIGQVLMLLKRVYGTKNSIELLPPPPKS